MKRIILGLLLAVALRAQVNNNLITVIPITNSSGTQTATGTLRFADLGTTRHFVNVHAPSTVTTTYDIFLPPSQGGANTVPSNDGAGNLTWVSSGAPPFSDLSYLFYNNADSTKRLAYSLSGITTGATRTITWQDASYTPAGINITETFTQDQTFQNIFLASTGKVIGTGPIPALSVRSTEFAIVQVSGTAASWNISSVLFIPAGGPRYQLQADNGVNVMTCIRDVGSTTSCDFPRPLFLSFLASPGNRCLDVNSSNQIGITSTDCATGTVSTISFTGGLITVANPTTTPAFSVAGTSGGIVYFSSNSTWASTAALGANLPVIGGGAGTAPTTGTRSGNTTTFVTTTGTQTSGDCVKIDANGNHIALGNPCGDVTLTGTQTISGVKTFSSDATFSNIFFSTTGKLIGTGSIPAASVRTTEVAIVQSGGSSASWNVSSVLFIPAGGPRYQLQADNGTNVMTCLRDAGSTTSCDFPRPLFLSFLSSPATRCLEVNSSNQIGIFASDCGDMLLGGAQTYTGTLTVTGAIDAHSSGNIYTRSFSGSGISCSGVNDGWLGWDTAGQNLIMCAGGNRFKVNLVSY